MDREFEVIRKYILQAGLWKFYLLAIGLLLVFILNVIKKEKGLFEKIAIISSGVLFSITVAFIILSSI